MRSASERLAAAGITLPPVAAPLAAYVPSRRSGDLIWTSGQLPLSGGTLVATGKLGGAVTTDVGRDAARTAALNAVAAVADQAGGVDAILRVVRVVVYVASTVDFLEQPQVANGASELLAEIFGPENGAHVRSAVGVSVLPLDAPVEVELVVEV
ncbi:RidA family protein [Tessaracoccus antarcticus]|uniref:RidA family protein n=1 Tax=Tessaracoccus antarcticus TaxID=2479848 RepID=A0A3M0GEX3_9ACTN|nr:RidA family protein [Tessaracoccus antarcticus]RMB61212.1 RidA family protein [Tessaracoccus antarcticus]